MRIRQKGTVSEKASLFGKRVPCHRDWAPNSHTPVPFLFRRPFSQYAYPGTLFAAHPRAEKGTGSPLLETIIFTTRVPRYPFFSTRLPRYPFPNTHTPVPFLKGYRGMHVEKTVPIRIPRYPFENAFLKGYRGMRVRETTCIPRYPFGGEEKGTVSPTLHFVVRQIANCRFWSPKKVPW